MKKLYKKTITLITVMYFTLLNKVVAFAAPGKLQNSKIAKGTEDLIKDATTWLMVLAPIAGALLVGFFFLRKGAADEMDQKMWQKRINVAVISTVGVEVASVIINLIVGYYI